MSRVEVFKCDDGSLENDIERAAAHNLRHRLPKGVNENRKVLEFSQCLAVIEHRDKIERIFAEMDAALAALDNDKDQRS